MDDGNVFLVKHGSPHVSKNELYISDSMRKSCFESGSNYFLVKTVDLLPYRGNVASPNKYDPLEEDLLGNPLTDWPILVLNCSTGSCTLVEGNNRHQVFYDLHRTWFPVRVRIEQDYLSEGGDTIWKTVQSWRENLASVLYKEFLIKPYSNV